MPPPGMLGDRSKVSPMNSLFPRICATTHIRLSHHKPNDDACIDGHLFKKSSTHTRAKPHQQDQDTHTNEDKLGRWCAPQTRSSCKMRAGTPALRLWPCCGSTTWMHAHAHRSMIRSRNHFGTLPSPTHQSATAEHITHNTQPRHPWLHSPRLRTRREAASTANTGLLSGWPRTGNARAHQQPGTGWMTPRSPS